MISSNIKEIMKKRKLTIRVLSEQSGISVVTLNKARQDEGIAECRLSTLGRIARAVNVPIKRLFDGEWEPQPPNDKPQPKKNRS